jgi:hypothetical protein
MGHMLLMYLIAMAFAIVSPLLLPFSVVWFAFAWLAWRHNLSYVYQRKYESGGMMWIFLFSRIIMCLVIGQLFTFCVLVVRGAYWQAFLIIAFMPALTLRYYRWVHAASIALIDDLQRGLCLCIAATAAATLLLVALLFVLTAGGTAQPHVRVCEGCSTLAAAVLPHHAQVLPSPVR